MSVQARAQVSKISLDLWLHVNVADKRQEIRERLPGSGRRNSFDAELSKKEMHRVRFQDSNELNPEISDHATNSCNSPK